MYGRGDDRFMDSDRLDDTAANLETPHVPKRHPAGRSCASSIAISAAVIGLISYLIVPNRSIIGRHRKV